jgi:hypothetical protein
MEKTVDVPPRRVGVRDLTPGSTDHFSPASEADHIVDRHCAIRSEFCRADVEYNRAIGVPVGLSVYQTTHGTVVRRTRFTVRGSRSDSRQEGCVPPCGRLEPGRF